MFKSMLSYVLLLPYVLALYQVTNLTRIMYPNNQIIDFGYHWVYTYNSGYINFTDWNGLTTNATISSGAVYMHAKVNMVTNMRRILTVASDYNLHLYENNSITPKYPLIPSIKNAVFVSENYVVGITTSQEIVKINYNTMASQKKYIGFKYNDSYLMAGIQTKIGVLSQGLNSTTLTVLNQNLTFINQIQFPQEGGQMELTYDVNTNFFVRCAYSLVQVYDSSLAFIQKFTVSTLKKDCLMPPIFFYSALICNNVLLISANDRIAIYQITNWTNFGCLTLSTFLISNKTRLKCYPQNLMFSVAFSDLSNNQIIQQFSINDTFTNLNNLSTLNSTLNNTVFSNTVPSNNKISNNIVQVISNYINSSESKNIAKSTFSVIGLCATSPLTQNFVKSFLSLLTDLWFYGYHSIKYTEFIELFTNQVDIWNELRIKPDIINDVVIPINYQQNQLYNSTSHLQMRARKTVFMLLSIQDIYIFNISICLTQWIVNIILKYFFRSLSQKYIIFFKIYKKILINSLWWSLLMTVIQPNISQVTFYGFIQMKDFYCFNLFSKISLIICVLLVFIVLVYSFCIFPIIKNFDGQQTNRYAFELSKRRSRASGVFLETFLRGIRCFSQALIHGVFINHNQAQLIGLVLLDLLFIGILLFFRPYFKRKIIFVFNMFYYLSLLSFDLMLTLFVSLQVMNKQTSEEYQKYQLASMVIILIITGAIFLKTLLEILKSIFDCGKFIFKKIREKRQSQLKIADSSQEQRKIAKQNKKQKVLKKKGEKQKKQQQKQKKITTFITNNYIKSKKNIVQKQEKTKTNLKLKIHIIRNGEVIN